MTRIRRPDRQSLHAALLALLLLATLLLASPPIQATTLTTVPGGVLSVPLGPGDQARFQGTPVLISEQRAIVGIGLGVKPGVYQLDVQTAGGFGYELEFRVLPKQYPEQHLTIPDQRKVNPYAEDMERIRSEAAASRAQYALRTPPQPGLRPLIRPTEGIVSSPFGRRRVLNGQPRNPHSGLDIAAATGTPIVAPAPGTVTLTGDLFFNGNTVFVDHGGGLVTMMCHMSRIDVNEGQVVARGDLLGAVGATGRVTGPHLHWNVSLNGARVDPLQAIAALTSDAN